MLPKLHLAINIIDIYHKYLDKKNGQNYQDRYKGNEKYFKASGAGGCYYKHLLGTKYKSDTPLTPGGVMTYQGMRNMRFGTILHTDMQTALKEEIKAGLPDGIEILVEQEIILDKLNVRGFLDYAIIDHNIKSIVLSDIKTLHSYKWSLMFGRKRQVLRDANESKMYEFQLATYMIWFIKEYPEYNNEMMFLYYKKDNSLIKCLPNPAGYISDAVDYWLGVNEFCEEETEKSVILGVTANCPMADWECNYCFYASHCNSPLIKKRNS